MVGRSPRIGAVGYLAALLAVWGLLMAGGMFTYAAPSHAHVHLLVSNGSAVDGHAHFGDGDLPDTGSHVIYCGADLLALSCELGFAGQWTIHVVEEGRDDDSPAKRIFSIEPPPPRFAS